MLAQNPKWRSQRVPVLKKVDNGRNFECHFCRFSCRKCAKKTKLSHFCHQSKQLLWTVTMMKRKVHRHGNVQCNCFAMTLQCMRKVMMQLWKALLSVYLQTSMKHWLHQAHLFCWYRHLVVSYNNSANNKTNQTTWMCCWRSRRVYLNPTLTQRNIFVWNIFVFYFKYQSWGPQDTRYLSNNSSNRQELWIDWSGLIDCPTSCGHMRLVLSPISRSHLDWNRFPCLRLSNRP